MSVRIKRPVLLLSALAVATTLAHGQEEEVLRPDKVIYGRDNREEVHQAPSNWQKVAASTAAMIPLENIQAQGLNGVTTYNLSQSTLMDEGICPGDAFAEQPIPAICSGFLVGPDLLVTAGHCGQIDAACEDFLWVFDFKVDPSTGKAGLNISADNVYKCKKIIRADLEDILGTDHALIQLERVVTSREPLKFRTTGKIDSASEVTVIGHPSGLPSKVASEGKMRQNEEAQYFTASLDTYHGNSGSAVFNSSDLTVEGILVRGDDDYVWDMDRMCMTDNICQQDECMGEDVSRITGIIELKERDNLLAAAAAGDKVRVESYLLQGGWADMSDNNKTTALMLASERGHDEIVELLLSKGADVNLQELTLGNSALHLAAKKGDKALVKKLLAAGADPKLKNKQGKSARKLAPLLSLGLKLLLARAEKHSKLP